MKKGDLINIRGTSPMSRLIRLLTRSAYSHSACYVGDKKIVESDWGGVQIKILPDRTLYDIYRHIDATEEQLETAVKWMLSQVGAKYDFMGLLWIGMNRLRTRKRNRVINEKKFWCSELIADGYLNAKIKLNVNFDTFKVCPEDLSRDERMVIVGRANGIIIDMNIKLGIIIRVLALVGIVLLVRFLN